MLVIYWAGCFILAFISVVYQILQSSQATTSVRKIFHILAILVYVPGLIFEPTFLYLASGLVFVLFSMIEVKILRIIID